MPTSPLYLRTVVGRFRRAEAKLAGEPRRLLPGSRSWDYRPSANATDGRKPCALVAHLSYPPRHGVHPEWVVAVMAFFLRVQPHLLIPPTEHLPEWQAS